MLCFFAPKQVFHPRTAKSQPIWIKFCTHLLLCGIHLWGDLDRDWHVGRSRPNQKNDYVFVILVTHPKLSAIWRRRIAAISAANCQSGGSDGCYREKFRNFVAWAEPDPKRSIFRVLGTIQLSCTQPTGNSFTPNQWYRWKAESL